MKPKIKIPLKLKLMKGGLDILQKLAPRYTNQLYARLFFRPRRFQRLPAEKPAQLIASRFSIDFKGGQVAGYRWGSGPKKMLFVHGWSGRASQGQAFIDPFVEEGYTVYALDLPAHAESDGNVTNLFECVEALKLFLNRFGSMDLAVCHSFGGLVATYAKHIGLPIEQWIMIGAPLNNQFIVDSYRQGVGAPQSFDRVMKSYVLKKFGVEFTDFGVDKLLGDLDRSQLLIIHDKEDKEVDILVLHDLLTSFPDLQHQITRGLGHKRILRDSKVISLCLDFANKKQLVSNL